MVKEDKTIKELKRVNHNLKHQYDLLQIRYFGLQANSEAKIKDLMKDLDIQEAQIIEQNNKISRLLIIAKNMHKWIFLHTDNEEEVYKELGLTQTQNEMLGSIYISGDDKE